MLFAPATRIDHMVGVDIGLIFQPVTKECGLVYIAHITFRCVVHICLLLQETGRTRIRIRCIHQYTGHISMACGCKDYSAKLKENLTFPLCHELCNEDKRKPIALPYALKY